jgi:hypothetical protein
VQQVIAILGVFVDLEQLDQQLADGVFLQAVDAAITVLVRQDQSQGRVEITADLGSPPGDEALDDDAPLLVGAELGRPVGSQLGARQRRAGDLLLVLVERVEKAPKEFREEKGLGVVVRAVWVSFLGCELPSSARTVANKPHFSSSSRSVSAPAPAPYCFSSSSRASSSGDLDLLV